MELGEGIGRGVHVAGSRGSQATAPWRRRLNRRKRRVEAGAGCGVRGIAADLLVAATKDCCVVVVEISVLGASRELGDVFRRGGHRALGVYGSAVIVAVAGVRVTGVVAMPLVARRKASGQVDVESSAVVLAVAGSRITGVVAYPVLAGLIASLNVGEDISRGRRVARGDLDSAMVPAEAARRVTGVGAIPIVAVLIAASHEVGDDLRRGAHVARGDLNSAEALTDAGRRVRWVTADPMLAILIISSDVARVTCQVVLRSSLTTRSDVDRRGITALAGPGPARILAYQVVACLTRTEDAVEGVEEFLGGGLTAAAGLVLAVSRAVWLRTDGLFGGASDGRFAAAGLVLAVAGAVGLGAFGVLGRASDDDSVVDELVAKGRDEGLALDVAGNGAARELGAAKEVPRDQHSQRPVPLAPYSPRQEQVRLRLA